MDQATWKQIEALFHQALELPAASRRNFVAKAAKGDSQLRLEVLTLLHSHESESGMLEGPSNLSDAVAILADDLGRSDNSASISATSVVTQIDNNDVQSSDDSGDAKLVEMIEATRKDFVVKRPISRGGMGVVFRVYQRELDRDVAVKVLSASHLDDRMRRRFVRESKAAAQVKNDHVIRIPRSLSGPRDSIFGDGIDRRSITETVH